MTLDVPELLILEDGTTAEVKAVSAMVVAGQLNLVVYTVEKSDGAWADIVADTVRRPGNVERLVAESK